MTFTIGKEIKMNQIASVPIHIDTTLPKDEFVAKYWENLGRFSKEELRERETPIFSDEGWKRLPEKI